MSTARFVVDNVGPHVSMQDGGRPSLMRYGVPCSGPMDRYAFAAANTALGNEAGAAGIEVSIGGIALRCVEHGATIAIAGGGFRVLVDDRQIAAWSVVDLLPGMRLTIRPGFWGNWCYIAFKGALNARAWLGSVSTYGPSNMGGGRLIAGQELLIDEPEIRHAVQRDVICPVFARPRPDLHVVLGPQDRFFAQETIEMLLDQPFRLTDAYDRMGVRLSGPSLRSASALSIPSEGIVRGSIQVSGDGIATVLLADHQTTGGYPKIATILASELDRFVQLRSRSQIRFHAVTPAEAIQITRTTAQSRARFMTMLATEAGRR